MSFEKKSRTKRLLLRVAHVGTGATLLASVGCVAGVSDPGTEESQAAETTGRQLYGTKIDAGHRHDSGFHGTQVEDSGFHGTQVDDSGFHGTQIDSGFHGTQVEDSGFYGTEVDAADIPSAAK
jgi:hypothetical protein